MGYAYDESPFVPLRTTQSGTTVPTPDMKDAEIAKLRGDVAALKTALAAYQSPEAAYALALRVIEQSQRAFRAEAALDGERQTADTFREAIRLLSAHFDDDPDEAAHTPPHIRQAIMDYDQRQAAPRAAGGG